MFQSEVLANSPMAHYSPIIVSMMPHGLASRHRRRYN
jgi:hypothetical protein